MHKDIKKLIGEMTLEEKAALCSGKSFWRFKGLERLGVPSLKVADGPHGLNTRTEAVNGGKAEKIPATCFPPAVNLASSWNPELTGRIAEAIAAECKVHGVDILLGPGVNIKRSPLCGRNFEYFSEDPYLSSEMAIPMIAGLQKNGIGACLKHFAANNREERRHTSDSRVGERALREIYLAAFERTVKKAQPWTVMAAYNKLNGEFCCENYYLLTEMLRDDWHFNGAVISDWYACNDKVKAVAAGLDIEMPPGPKESDLLIAEAVRNGQLEESVLDTTVERILTLISKATAEEGEASKSEIKADQPISEETEDNNINGYSAQRHHFLAREAAAETMVLLKNEDHILPLRAGMKIAVIGGFAKSPRYQGSGSSRLLPSRLDNLVDELLEFAGSGNLEYAPGYDPDRNEEDPVLLRKAVQLAGNADVAVLCVGLPDSYEKEGWDRTHLRLPPVHLQLIEEITAVQPRTVVVLSNGAPVEMPWLHKVKGVLEAYLGGQAGAGAAADILYGRVNPSGRLAETFPVKLSDTPCYLDFFAYPEVVEYGEGIFTGYRYYEKKEVAPLFPFGYGLSYTTFEFTAISTSSDRIRDDETVQVRVKVRNTGNVKGREVVQLYIQDISSTIIRPRKELKAFAKVELEPDEEKEALMTLDFHAFAYFDKELGEWQVESGEFRILAGASSAEILQEKTITVERTKQKKKKVHMNTAIADVKFHPAGRLVYDYVMQFSSSTDVQLAQMHLQSLIAMSGGQFTSKMLQELIDGINGEGS